MKQPQPLIVQQVNTTPHPSDWIRKAFARSGVQISDEQIRLLENYVALLLDWNTRVNLVSRRDVGNIWESHVAHCLSPFLKISLPETAAVLDLGTGGGLPGIPWKILFPGIRMILLDSTQKKINAVQSMVAELGLSDTEALWGRAEELCRTKKLADTFDYVVARGVGPLVELANLGRPFLRRDIKIEPAGKTIPPIPSLLAFKGGGLEQEVERTRLVKNVESVNVIPLSFSGGASNLTEKKLVIVGFRKEQA